MCAYGLSLPGLEHNSNMEQHNGNGVNVEDNDVGVSDNEGYL